MASQGRTWVGTSGWSYDSWDGAFYPDDLPRRRRLEHATRRFNSIEINGSFYSLQTPASYRKWYEAAPSDFRFAVKGSRFITHNKKLGDARTALANFFASGPLRLGDKLGPILWQLPDHVSFDRERVEAFLDLLPHDTEPAAALAREHDRRLEGRSWTEPGGRHRLRHAIEPRHDSWFEPEFVRVARERGVAGPRDPKRKSPRRGRGLFGSRDAAAFRLCYEALVTFAACGPFGPCVTSNSTRSFSERLLKPSA